ncbi:MAG: DUF1697 domain-containing protein [Ornithinimicrobium sp.]
MTEVVALLRSVNVGGNRMKMDWLRALAVGVGCEQVRTVLATGNVVMSASPDLDRVRQDLEQALADRFGVISVVMRTHGELVESCAHNPWAGEVTSGALEGRAVHTIFCRREPSAEAVAGLERDGSQDDFAVVGRHVYLRLGGSAADTRYTGAWFERHLKVVGTARNHNTVLKLIAATA